MHIHQNYLMLHTTTDPSVYRAYCTLVRICNAERSKAAILEAILAVLVLVPTRRGAPRPLFLFPVPAISVKVQGTNEAVRSPSRKPVRGDAEEGEEIGKI